MAQSFRRRQNGHGDFSQTPGANFVVPAGTSYAGQTPLTPFHCDLSTGLPTGGTQTNNVICPTFFDPAAGNIVGQAIPTANTTTGSGQAGWKGVIPNPFTTDEYLGKIDHNFGSDNRLSASYYTTAGENTIRAGTSGQGLPWALQEFNWRQHKCKRKRHLDHQSDESEPTVGWLYALFWEGG